MLLHAQCCDELSPPMLGLMLRDRWDDIMQLVGRGAIDRKCCLALWCLPSSPSPSPSPSLPLPSFPLPPLPPPFPHFAPHHACLVQEGACHLLPNKSNAYMLVCLACYHSTLPAYCWCLLLSLPARQCSMPGISLLGNSTLLSIF